MVPRTPEPRTVALAALARAHADGSRALPGQARLERIGRDQPAGPEVARAVAAPEAVDAAVIAAVTVAVSAGAVAATVVTASTEDHRSRGQAATKTSQGGNPELCYEQMFRSHRHAGYIALMRGLRLQHAWQLGDWYWNESTGQPNLVARRDDGSYMPFRDPAWLPPLTHWLDALRAEGIVSIEFTRDSDDPAVRIIRAWGSGPWRATAEGRGLTDEEAAAHCWTAVRRE